MGRMTDQMQTLSREVARLRQTRAAFIGSLAERVAGLRRGARQTQSRVRDAHAEMSRRLREEAQQFLSGLRGAVDELEKAAYGARRELAADLAGARLAWAANSGAFRRAPVKTPARQSRARADPTPAARPAHPASGAPRADRKRKFSRA